MAESINIKFMKKPGKNSETNILKKNTLFSFKKPLLKLINLLKQNYNTLNNYFNI